MNPARRISGEERLGFLRTWGSGCDRERKRGGGGGNVAGGGGGEGLSVV